MAHRRKAQTKAPRICASGDGQALDSIPPGYGRGAGARGETGHQRGAPSLPLKEELTAILETLPPPKEMLGAEHNRSEWKSWQEGLSVKITLPLKLPPLRMLLVWDNLVGHLKPSFYCGCSQGGSWRSTHRLGAVG